MTTYYVGAGGNNSNTGTSWAQRKLTLNGAEDIPVAAGDTVYVGAGTYREQLTCDVSGSSGSPITYIGDYTGANTDGTGGVVRITGSDDDQTVTRASGISVKKDYRTFSGFVIDAASTGGIYIADADITDLIVEKCYFANSQYGIINANKKIVNFVARNCFFTNHIRSISLGAVGDDTNGLIENCLFVGGSHYNEGTIRLKHGGFTIKNCTFYANYTCIYVDTLTSGQTIAVNNCNFYEARTGIKAITAGNIVEDYNNIWKAEIARSNVTSGAHSTAYPMHFDTRWFFEMVNGGSMLTPFDLASYSQLINVAGTSPTTADMRGTTVQGTQREWGALEYDSTLDIEAGSGGGGGAVSIQPLSGRLGL